MGDTRIRPGAEGRKSYVNRLNKDPLQDECLLVDEELIAAERRIDALRGALAVEKQSVADVTAAALLQGERAVDAQEEQAAQITALQAKVLEERNTPRVSPDTMGLLPMVLHVSGVEWNGTARTMVRCGTGGDLKDLWVARFGNRMLTTSGQLIQFKPYMHSRPSLQRQIGWTLEAGIRALAKA